MKVPSPCLQICIYDHQLDYCTGCYRTIDEIKAWRTLSESSKQQVVDLLPERRLNNSVNSIPNSK